jgi:ATP-binding cassette subfamily B protein
LLLVSVIPSFIGEWHFNAKSYSLQRGWTPQRRELDYYRFIGASDETAKEVKLFGLSDFIIERFRNLSYQYFEENKKLSIERASWGSLLVAIGTFGYFGAYTMILIDTVKGIVTIGSLTFLAGSFRQLKSLLEGILGRFTSISQGALYLNDLFEFYLIEPQITSPISPKPFPNPIKEGFRFVNVGFKYPNSDKWANKNLNFDLKVGEKLALVGENGSGKTTLVKLLARLYDPDEGRILLDGVDLKEYNLVELREHIGVIFQDFQKFNFTAGDNIAVGDISSREELSELERAAHQSLADTVIEKLPLKYGQPLGRKFAKGIELSGGEWQKIALARAYLRETDVLILDEPTAALDARAEYEVFRRFADLTKGKTAILISHRFSTVRMADRILVLDKGQMLEIGTHEELLEKNGRYAELFYLQAEGYR